MTAVWPRDLEELTSALFEVFAGSLWAQLLSADVPDLAWPPPPGPVGVIDIHFSITRRDGLRGLRVPIVGSQLPQPWGAPQGEKPQDWAREIRMWLEEQIAQGCDVWARRDDDGYVAYFEITREGLRPDESKRH